MFENIARFILDKLNLRAAHCLTKDGYLVETGWLRSFKTHAAVDRDGNPIPWIAYPALDFISSRVKLSMTVFEYGSGASTRWWSSRVARVDSVEHDRNWYNLVAATMPQNVNLVLHENDAYFDQVKSSGIKYDLIIIDGIERNRCVQSALDGLSSSGVIIWDDSERQEYQQAFAQLRQLGFKQLPFSGLSPIYNNRVETSIFYRSNNCLEI